MGLNVRYSLNEEESRKSFHFSANRNTIQDLSSGINNIGDIENMSFLLGSSFNIWTPDLTLSPSINYSQYSYSQSFQERYGGSLGISWKMEKVISLNFRSLYNLNDFNYQHNGYVLRNSLSANFRIREKQSIQLRLSHIKRSSTLRPSFTEYRTSLGYGFKF